MSQDREIAEAVAVIGMSCRFSPDLDSLDKLWSFLIHGRSSVRDMPDRRWEPYASSSPQATAIMRKTTRRGSFLDDIEGFDAEFFGISPREADFLDPQQRILLELAWEALVHAGVPPLGLRGTEAGVFTAANSNDYGRRLLEDVPLTGAYAVNGTTYYGIANRISYFLDLRGLSVAVDTACAGSLTALHLACRSIRLGETPVAIVGGVNIMATPALFVALDAAGATSPDGRSKAFDKSADGYGRGEGAGVVVLKRLVDARRDGDPILALVVGSGVFQDGRSDGMMAPNSEAQEHMLRQVYARAGIAPETVGYVEAHGTGTPVGDREEAQALARVFGSGRAPDQPCLIGSLKPNIGHVEGGSGIAGVIKAVLALHRGEIPPSLHSEPHPGVDWRASGLRLVGERSPWPAGGKLRRAGVSSYGVGGTIAHLILQEAPARTGQTVTGDGISQASVFPLSAMSEAGLRALAAKTAAWLHDNPDVSTASVGHTLTRRRSHLAQRAAITAASTTELAGRLSAVAQGRCAPGVVEGRTESGQAAEVVWVFSGHGTQWSGMGRRLLRDDPAFAGAMDALEGVFGQELGWTPREAITEGGPWTTSQIQAMTFAMQIGLAAVWRRRGVTPGAIIGHSVGEIAAAVTAGCLDLDQAARFACRRANALRRSEGPGAMAMVGLPWQVCRDRLAGAGAVVPAIAASPSSTVVSGDREAVERLAAQWQAEGIDVRRVDTNIAFHSHHVDAVIADVAAAAGDLDARAPRVALYSTALSDPRTAVPRDTDYWTANLRRPVCFAQAVEAAVADGHRVFLELSPHPVVTHSILETFDHLGVEDATAVPSTRRDTDEVETLLSSLAELHCGGAAIDWSQQHAGGRLVDLPAVAWQHRPYWIFPDNSGDARFGGGHDPDRHTLLGGCMTVSGSPTRQVWQTQLDLSCRPYPQSHEVVGVEITPAAVLINTFVSAAARNDDRPGLSDIVLRTPVAVTPPRVVQIVRAGNTVQLSSRIAGSPTGEEDQEWLTHCAATVDRGKELSVRRAAVAAIRARCDQALEWSAVDAMFRRQGVGGYAFLWFIDELSRNHHEQLAALTIEPAPARQARSWAQVIDGALTISAVVVTPKDARRLWMSCHIGSVVFRGEPPARIVVHSQRSAYSPDDTVDVTVADESGRVVCEVGGLRFAPLQDEPGAVAAARDLVHEIMWHPFSVDEQGSGGRIVRRVVVVGDGAVASRLDEQFTEMGMRCERLLSPEDLRPESLATVDAVLVAPERAGQGESPEQSAEDAAWMLIRTVQHLTHVRDDEEAGSGPRLWCLTQGVRAADNETSLAHAPLWGASRIIAGEHPELWGGVVDVPEFDAGIGRRLLRLLRHAAGAEDIISLTGSEAAVPRLSPIGRPQDGTTLQCHPSGTYLITGGLGALGLAVSQWLVDRGARRFLLVGRRGLPPRAEWGRVRDTRTLRQIEGVLKLEARGATVRVLALDTGDADELAAALAPSTHGLPAVRGVVHAAGVVRDAMVDKVDREELHDVLWPKVAGAMALHRLFPPGSLDFFVLFSSCGQFARLTGQTSYAAANSFLDLLAAYRQASGHAETVSLAWTAWRGMGMSETIAGTMLEANARGLDAISFAEAFRAWSFADRFAGPYKAIMRVRPLSAGAPRVPMYRELNVIEDEGTSGFARDWADLPEQEQRDLVIADIRDQVGTELNLAAEDIELKRPLVELGVDSVMTVALRVRLQRRYGLDLPPNILWNKPSVAALGTHVAGELRSRETPAGEGI